MPNNREVNEVLHRFETGEMTRRNFARAMTLLGVSTFVTNAVMQSPLGATRAFAAISGPEERAWALAKEAAAKASKKTLTILIPTGSIGNMTPYVDKWKKELGISIEFIEEPDEVVHTKGMQEAVAKTGRYGGHLRPDGLGAEVRSGDFQQGVGRRFPSESSRPALQWPRCGSFV